MRTLINIENFGRRDTQSFKERFNAKIYGERGAYAPRKNVSTVPIDNCEQIDKAAQQSNVCDIGAPDLIGIFDSFPSEGREKPYGQERVCSDFASGKLPPSQAGS